MELASISFRPGKYAPVAILTLLPLIDERRYVKTSILSAETFAHVASRGVQFAEAQDAGSALLRLLSDTTINGRSLFVSARKWAPAGYFDLDVDDYPGNELIQEIQVAQMAAAPVEEGLFAR